MLFEARDYRDYLRKYLASLPKNGRGELSRLAQHLGVNNTLLSQVLAGTRDLSGEQAFALTRYWGFDETHTDYFLTLVQIERAGTKAFRDHLDEKRRRLRDENKKLANRVKTRTRLGEEERRVFYSSWIYSAIHLWTTTNPEGVTVDEIANRLGVARARVQTTTAFLAEVGLIVSHGSRWRVGVESTFLEHGSPHLPPHHRNWRLRAIEKAETITKEELMYTAQVTLSREDFEKIRALLVETIDRSAKIVLPSPAEDLACLHVDWFWL